MHACLNIKILYGLVFSFARTIRFVGRKSEWQSLEEKRRESITQIGSDIISINLLYHYDNKIITQNGNNNNAPKWTKNKFNTILKFQSIYKICNLSWIGTQGFRRARRERTTEQAITAPERGTENADPTSGDGAGARAPSWADTVAAVEKIATTAKTSIKAFVMPTCAIGEQWRSWSAVRNWGRVRERKEASDFESGLGLVRPREEATPNI